MTIEQLYKIAKQQKIEKYDLVVRLTVSELGINKNRIKIDKEEKCVQIYYTEEELNSVGWI